MQRGLASSLLPQSSGPSVLQLTAAAGSVRPVVSVPVLHHLSRVDRPVPSLKHPLAGLWKGHCGRHGVQVMVVTYDFSGPAARIVATKVQEGFSRVPTHAHCQLAGFSPLSLLCEPIQLSTCCLRVRNSHVRLRYAVVQVSTQVRRHAGHRVTVL